jgi:tetratricopeptide (TPR) repeat protein
MNTNPPRNDRPPPTRGMPARCRPAGLIFLLLAGFCPGEPPSSPSPPSGTPAQSLAAGKDLAAKGRFADARAAYERALDLARKAYDRAAEGQALVGLGNALLDSGDPTAGESTLRQALDVFTARGDLATGPGPLGAW